MQQLAVSKSKIRSSNQNVDFEALADQLWKEYDDDNTGSLDKEETWEFVKLSLSKLWADFQLSPEAFDKVFAVLDADGSGTIEKGEMVEFLRQLA